MLGVDDSGIFLTLTLGNTRRGLEYNSSATRQVTHLVSFACLVGVDDKHNFACLVKAVTSPLCFQANDGITTAALIIRRGFWCILYYNYDKEPPETI